MTTRMSPPRLSVVRDLLPPFPANPAARAAYDELEDACKALRDDLMDKISSQSVGAPGSTELMRKVAQMVSQAREVLRPVIESEEEERRWQLFSEQEDRTQRASSRT
jgi:hypothetical protein